MLTNPTKYEILIFIKVIETIDNVDKDGNEKSLMENFCSPSHSDYFVAYLR
jgi:hypothetical protein